MRPELRYVHCAEVWDLAAHVPNDPTDFGVSVQFMIGPEGERGEESFNVVVCSPAWLAREASERSPLDLRHHLLLPNWDWPAVLTYVRSYLADIDRPSWDEVGEVVGRLGLWEFEDYYELKDRPCPGGRDAEQ